jgi:hypothetical protein
MTGKKYELSDLFADVRGAKATRNAGPPPPQRLPSNANKHRNPLTPENRTGPGFF